MCTFSFFPDFSAVENLQRDFNQLLEGMLLDAAPQKIYFAGSGLLTSRLEMEDMARLDFYLQGEQDIKIYPSGQGTETKFLRVHALEAIYFPPFAPFHQTWEKPCKGIGIVWTESFIRLVAFRHDGGPRSIKRSPLYYHTQQAMSLYGSHLLSAMNVLDYQPHTSEAAPKLLTLILAETLRILQTDRAPSKTNSGAQWTWFEVERYLETRLHLPLTRLEVATEMQLSPGYLSRLCHRITGRTYQQQILHLRLELAKQLLRHSRLRVKEIAIQCGFKHPGHFNAAFQKQEGQPPGRWRRE